MPKRSVILPFEERHPTVQQLVERQMSEYVNLAKRGKLDYNVLFATGRLTANDIIELVQIVSQSKNLDGHP